MAEVEDKGTHAIEVFRAAAPPAIMQTFDDHFSPLLRTLNPEQKSQLHKGLDALADQIEKNPGMLIRLVTRLGLEMIRK